MFEAGKTLCVESPPPWVRTANGSLLSPVLPLIERLQLPTSALPRHHLGSAKDLPPEAPKGSFSGHDTPVATDEIPGSPQMRVLLTVTAKSGFDRSGFFLAVRLMTGQVLEGMRRRNRVTSSRSVASPTASRYAFLRNFLRRYDGDETWSV